MTTWEDVIARATAVGIPITENEFRVTKQNPAPDPPFLVYLHSENQRGTDEKNRIREVNGSIELYTDRKPDPEYEKKIEDDVLSDIEFTKEQVLIQSENMVQTSYDFTITQKKGRSNNG